MSDFSDVGQLKYFYLENIAPNEDSNESEFLVNATAKILAKNGGRNWIPLIVKETGADQYQVVGSNFIHTVAEAAGLEKVWCIVIEPTPEAEETTKVLAKEIVPKVNLSNASRDEIKATLQYLIGQPGSPLKTVNLLSATEKLEQASREYWNNFDPVTKLSCGITKGKKLDAFKTAFYLTPLILPPPPPVNLSNASRDEIESALRYLVNQPDSPFKNFDLLLATEKIEQASRKYWTDFSPITKLGCGITKGKKLDSLKKVFYLMPLQKELPSIDELKALNLPALRKIAKERAVPGYAKMSKVALLDYFSQ
jgi:hypothetical protein